VDKKTKVKLVKLQRSIEIAAAAGRIWPLLVEPVGIKKWCGPVKRIYYTGQQHSGIGTPFYFEERAMGTLMKLHFAATEWIVNRSVAFKMTSGNLVKGYEQRYTLEPIPTGIRVTIFENVIMPYGILGKAFEVFRRSVSEAHLEGMLVNLKSLAEA
jgi:hypothetical protein